jgi:hypothetical protein
MERTKSTIRREPMKLLDIVELTKTRDLNHYGREISFNVGDRFIVLGESDIDEDQVFYECVCLREPYYHIALRHCDVNVLEPVEVRR